MGQNVKGLDAQFEWFKNWKTEVLSVAGSEKGNFIISNALYAISTGTNDWVNNYYVNLHLQSEYPKDKYVTLLVDSVRTYTMVRVLFLSRQNSISFFSLKSCFQVYKLRDMS